MCGIIGYIGKKKTLPVLIEGLKRLEYRGYDSAGFAVLDKDKIFVKKAVGRIYNLEKKADFKKEYTLGIAHTRWATHGEPTEENAHPHLSLNGEIAVVHNGIIENYQSLKEELLKKGYKFKSQTDSEVLAYLIEENYKGDLKEAVLESLKKVIGTYGLAVVSSKNPGEIIAARLGSPLILGIGEEENFIASDVSAILGHTKQVVFLNDGEVAVVKKDSFEISDINNQNINSKISEIEWNLEDSEKQGYPHFMIKEILESPLVVENALRGRLLEKEGTVKLGGLEEAEDRLRKINKIIIVACGTARYAGLVGEYMLEEYAGIPTDVEFASEFRYRKPVLEEKTLVLAISQSGETADTLEAIREAKRKGALTLGIVNVVGSTIAREVDAGLYNYAGPEVAVASTKAFVSQLTVLVLLTLMLGRQRGMSLATGQNIIKELEGLPLKIKEVLKGKEKIKEIAKKYAGYSNFMYLGRKYSFPIAEEGALKLKEISYIHAEGFPAGEMKHGSIALVDKNFPVFAIAPKDSVFEKNLSNIEEIKTRKGKIIILTTEGQKQVEKLAEDVIYIPKTLEFLTPILAVAPLQLFAYYVAAQKGLDVDKPRNLAKSVTVE